jgi:branched-chain amino acid aminotransferase
MALKKTKSIWFNGKLIPWEKATTHILTHGLHYGSGVFEGIRCYKTPRGPAIFKLRAHMQRLAESAKIYRMPMPYSVDYLCDATKKLIKANNISSCYIRPIVYRGYGSMGLNPNEAPVETAIACWSWGSYLGEEGLKKGRKAKISSYTRIAPNTMPPRAKATGQYINSILAKLEAMDCGYDEALLLDNKGMISEGPGENIFMIKNQVIYTPPLHASILPGITRDSAMDIAKDIGLEVRETDIDRGMLYTADEAFFTGTAAELTPIREVDGIKIGPPGPITRKIQDIFFKAVKGEEKKYESWLEYI